MRNANVNNSVQPSWRVGPQMPRDRRRPICLRMYCGVHSPAISRAPSRATAPPTNEILAGNTQPLPLRLVTICHRRSAQPVRDARQLCQRRSDQPTGTAFGKDDLYALLLVLSQVVQQHVIRQSLVIATSS